MTIANLLWSMVFTVKYVTDTQNRALDCVQSLNIHFGYTLYVYIIRLGIDQSTAWKVQLNSPLLELSPSFLRSVKNVWHSVSACYLFYFPKNKLD